MCYINFFCQIDVTAERQIHRLQGENTPLYRGVPQTHFRQGGPVENKNFVAFVKSSKLKLRGTHLVHMLPLITPILFR